MTIANQSTKIGVGISGGVELSGGFFKVGDQVVNFVDIRDRASGCAGDAANHSLSTALAEHFACIRIVGVDDHAIGNIAAQLRVGVSGWVKDFGIDSADSFF